LHDGVTPEFVAILRKLEFRALLRQVESQASPTDASQAQAAANGLTPANKVDAQAVHFIALEPRVVTLNAEASELWVSAKPGEYAIVPFKDAAAILDGPLIGHNLKATFRALMAQNLPTAGLVAHDTRIAAFLLNSLQRSVDLGDLVEQTISPDDAGTTIAAIWQLYDEQKQAFAKLPELHKLATDIEFPTVYLLAKMEHRGILLDAPYLNQMSKEFEKKIGVLERNIYAKAGQEFNIGSPAQLGTILYEKLSLPTQGVKKGKTGAYSTGVAELDKLRPLHPIIDLITQYREYTKLKSTYIDALPKLMDDQGKLHTTYALDVAATGRLSSHDPNLQNIPTRTEMGNAIRTAFVPAEGNVFVSADYSQFELRLAAVMANDTKLIEDFNQDLDVHTKTAAEIYSIPMEDVSKAQRRHAKMVNFAVLYGMSPHGLSIATGMSMVEAKDFITKYFELRKPIREYIDRTLKDGLENGYVQTMLGRRRPTPDLKSSNWVVRQAAQRAAANMPIQGTEADLMKKAMLVVEDKLQGLGEQLLQVHDSILVETPEANASEVAKILKETMENIYPLPVHLKVDVSTGKNWGEL
jgi:DNA polymerase-1